MIDDEKKYVESIQRDFHEREKKMQEQLKVMDMDRDKEKRAYQHDLETTYHEQFQKV